MNEFLKSEFDKLKNDNVISEEIYSKIINYYENINEDAAKKALSSDVSNNETQTEQIKEQNCINPSTKQTETPLEKPLCETSAVKNTAPVSPLVSKQKKEKKKINFQMILSIISSLLIGGGIISLIAYNWNDIPRFAKSIAAFVICIMAPVLYVVLTKLRRTEFEQKSKEFFAILWNLLFGGSIAFISQTYRMASNPVAFFIAWLFISIGITYALKSYCSFCFSLLLTVIYCIYSQQFTCNVAVLFYPAMFLNYFFARKNKKCFYIWLIELISLISVVFEKCLPGLWIIAYVSINVLLLNYAEKTNDKNCRILGYVQAFALAVILAIPHFWEKIGFAYYRDNALYNRLGGLVDYIVTFALYAGSLGITLSSIIKNIKNKIHLKFSKVFELIVLAVIAGLYFCSSFISGFSIYVPRIFLLFYFALFFYSILKDKTELCAVSFALIIYGIILGKINFIFALIYTVLLSLNVILQKSEYSETGKKISLSLIYILLLLSRIFLSEIFDFLILFGAAKQCTIFDFIIASGLMTLVIAFLAAKNINFKNLTIKQLISKLNLYIAAIFLGTTCILFNYNSSNLKNIIDIFIAITAILSIIDFVINKSVQSYFGLALFVINYFFMMTDANSCIFIFAISYLILYAVLYYFGENFQQIKNYNYFRSISYFTIFLFNYFIFYNSLLKDNVFNPFVSAKSSVFFILMLSALFIIPVFKQIKEHKLNDLTSLAVTSVSVIFLIFSQTEKIFNAQNFIFSVLIISFLISCLETVINKKIENLLMIVASLIICFVELSFHQNYLNGIAFISMLLFALYYYASYFAKDKKNLNMFINACLCFLFFIAILLDVSSTLKNAEKILLFSSANRIISTIVILPVLIIIPSVFYIKNKDFPSLTCSSFGFVSLLFYLLNDYCNFFNAANYLFVLSLFAVISSFVETFVFNKKENVVVFVLSLIEFIRYSCHDDGITIFLLFILGAFALFVYTHILSGKNNYNFAFVTFVMSLMLIISMLFEFSKHSYISITPEDCVKYYISVSIALISMFIIPCFYCIKKRIKINYVQIAFCLLWIVNFILFSTCSNLNLEAYQRISSGISLGLIIAFSIFGLYLSYETTSIKSANYYLFFLSIAFIIRFFMISKGLVERGIVCIVCGICILAVNMIFSKKLAKTEENKIEQGE
ncbi:MAG: DUF2157 domain-containing protein [Treponemataceae bacterium]|nr:DUF2157 domain-containing protein [Treponemataceae bacterium]